MRSKRFPCSVSPDAPPPTWEQLEKGLVAVKTVVHGLVDFIQNHSKKGADPQQVGLSIETGNKQVPVPRIYRLVHTGYIQRRSLSLEHQT